jgi:RNA polymerase sigma-70 factor (ECF subfamily)
MVTESQTTKYREILTAAHLEHSKGLNAHSFFKVPDQSISEDLVQDTFVKTWRYLLRGGKIDIMKAFLYHILNHLIIDEYRKKKALSLDTLLLQGFEPSVNPSERIINILDGKRITMLIPLLPERYRAVLRMKYIQQLTLHEMSKITGQKKNTLAVQIYRGLQKLKKLYQP